MGIIEENLRYDGGMINIFHTVGCLGDSLASGEFEYDNNGETGYWDAYDYSWGKVIERLTGISVTNYSYGGLTAWQMYKDATEQNGPNADINRLFCPEDRKQAYIIALGANDLNGVGNLEKMYGGIVGTSEDICKEDWRKNADSFVGVYAKIIQRLKENQPDARFFLVAMPNDKPENIKSLEVCNAIASVLDKCYVLDLFHEAPNYDAEFQKKYFMGGHMNPMGYVMTAYYIMTYIDYIIMQNPKEFQDVAFMGTTMKFKDTTKS